MRVVHLNTNHRWGGGENQLFHLVQGTLGSEFNPLLIARRNGELLRRAQEKQLPVESFEFVSRYGPFSISRLASLLRERGAEILHLHDGDAVSLGVPAGSLNPQIKVVVHRRIASPLRNNFLTRWKYSPKRVHAYIAVSESAKKSLTDFGIPAEKIEIIPSGVDTEKLSLAKNRSELRKELGLSENLWIGTVTSLETKKNNSTFLNAAALISKKFPESKFLVVGDGPERKQLEESGRRLGLDKDKLRFVGFQEHAHRYTAAMDLFLFPSFLEGSPAALKEAMALEVPVIAANAPGNNEVIQGAVGVLVPAKDPEIFADAAEHLLKNTAQTREMSKKAAAWVRSHFDMKNMVEKTAALYRKLI